MEHVDHVFSSFIGQGIIKEDILDMMEWFGLITKFSVSPADVKYFVPAQLKSSPEDLCKMKPSPSDPCPLYLHFVHGFVPHGLFLQLVSRSIRWCCKTWPTQHPTLYRNGAWFIIGEQIHDFVLICKTGFVKIILRQRTQSHRVVGKKSAELATVVREFVEETLQRLPQELPYLRGLQYRLCVAPCVATIDALVRILWLQLTTIISSFTLLLQPHPTIVPFLFHITSFHVGTHEPSC